MKNCSPEVERYVAMYGERNRKTIEAALDFLVDDPILDVDGYIDELMPRPNFPRLRLAGGRVVPITNMVIGAEGVFSPVEAVIIGGHEYRVDETPSRIFSEEALVLHFNDGHAVVSMVPIAG